MPHMQVVLDTNALVYAARNKIDLVDELKRKFGLIGVYVPNLVINELKQIKATGKKVDRENADLALDILRHKKLPIIEMQGITDDEIAKWAEKNKAAVLTNDVELKFMLRDLGLTVFHIRQGKYIEEWG